MTIHTDESRDHKRWILSGLRTYKHPKGKWYYIATLTNFDTSHGPDAEYRLITSYGAEGKDGVRRYDHGIAGDGSEEELMRPFSCLRTMSAAKDRCEKRRLAHGYKVVDNREKYIGLRDGLLHVTAKDMISSIGCAFDPDLWFWAERSEEGVLKWGEDEARAKAHLETKPTPKPDGAKAKPMKVGKVRSGAATIPSCSDWRKRLGL